MSKKKSSRPSQSPNLPADGSPQHTGAAFGLGSGAPAAAESAAAALGLGAGQPQLLPVPGPDAQDSPEDDLGDDLLDGLLDDELLDELDYADIWPEFLGEPPSEEDLDRATLTADDTYPARSVLAARADEVMALVGEGIAVSEDDGLDRAATAELLSRFGSTGDPGAMWLTPSVAVLWGALQDSGFISVQEGIAQPAAIIVPWVGPEADPDERLSAARVLHAAAFAVVLGTPTEDEEEEDTASPFTYMALLAAALPGGVRVTPTADPHEAEHTEEVSTDLRILHDSGLLDLDEDGQTYRLDPSLLEMLPAAVAALMAEDDEQ